MKNFAVDNVREIISLHYGHKTLGLGGMKSLTGITLRWHIHLCGENWTLAEENSDDMNIY